MLSLLEQSCEAFAGALGKPCAAAIPASDQTCHEFGRFFDHNLSASRPQRFQRIAHHLGLGATGLPGHSFKQGRHFRIDPDVELTHDL
jgi:hypothetical protein